MHRIALRFALAVLLPLAIALALAPACVRAETAASGMPGEWLAQFTTARALGMGGAGVATGPGALAALWNPAALSFHEQNELAFENARLFEDTHVNAFGLVVPASRLPSVGVGMVSLSSGGFQRTNELNDDLGTFDEGETAWLFTLSHTVTPRAAVGASATLVRQTVESFSGGGFGMSVGGLVNVTPTLRFGLTLSDLGGPTITLRDTPEQWPMRVRGGGALAVLNGRGLVTFEVDHAAGPGMTFHGGSEYWLMPTLALRAGYDDARGTGGFTYRFAPQYELDYAVANNPLGMTQRVGLSMRFGGFFSSSRAEPDMFSPTGEHAVTQIALNAHTKADVDHWSLDVLDKSDHVVRRFGGPGRPPDHVEWDGKDDNGLPLADGTYRYRLTVQDREGRVMVSPMKRLVITTSGPQGTVPVEPAK
jgi:flagellar hook capping protein FlgD